MQWARVMAVLSGVILLLYATAATTNITNTFAAGKQVAALELEIPGCTNGMSCGAEYLVGDEITFDGALTAEDGTPIAGAEVAIVKLLPTPELVVVASGITGIDGTYSIPWEVAFTETTKTFQDVTKKMLSESVVFFAEFEGDDAYSSTRTAKLTVTIEANKLTTVVNAEKSSFPPGEAALIFVAFIDRNDEFVDPDSLRVVFDDEDVEVERKKTGSFTFMTPELTIDHHQLIVLPKKDGYNNENGYLTVVVQGVEDLPRSIVKRDR